MSKKIKLSDELDVGTELDTYNVVSFYLFNWIVYIKYVIFILKLNSKANLYKNQSDQVRFLVILTCTNC